MMTTMKLTEHQAKALRDIAANKNGEFFGTSSPMRSLVLRGLAVRRRIGMGWWRYALTDAGRTWLNHECPEPCSICGNVMKSVVDR